MEIVKIKLNEIKPYGKNAKLHPERQIEQIMTSIKEFGNNDPIALDEDYVIIEGHGRYEALKRLGYEEAECIILKGLSEDKKNAYRLVHNKLTMNSDFDFDLLVEELEAIDFDMEQFDFEVPDFEEETQGDDDDFDIDNALKEEPISKKGDLYQLGEHYLLCGDSTIAEDVSRLMGDKRENLFLTDPPYNVNYEGIDGKREKIENDHFESDEECGEKLWLPAFENARDHASEDCSVYCFMPQGGTHMMMMMMMMMNAGWQVKHELIWRKQSIVLNRADYNYQHEPILYGWNEKHTFYGKGQYKNTSVWDFDRPTKSKEHPTMKPVDLLKEILLNSSKQGDIVLDLFGGSGSTLIACEELKRKCMMIEFDPKYCDVIIKRWENITGKKARKVE